jgi:hypothetical protein
MKCTFVETEERNAAGWTRKRCINPGCRMNAFSPGPLYCNFCESKSAVATKALCSHFGAETRQQVCDSCRGKQRIKVFACAVHGECSLGKQLEGVAYCKGCKEYAPTPPENPS